MSIETLMLGRIERIQIEILAIELYRQDGGKNWTGGLNQSRRHFWRRKVRELLKEE